MYAIIREGNGKYYTSMVFGYYNTTQDRWDYNHRYWVVLNREKTALVNQHVLELGSKSLDPLVIAVDSDQSNWNCINDNTKSVDFLPTESLCELIQSESVPADLIQKCIILDRDYEYNPYPAIESEQNCLDIDWVTGGFHDGQIVELQDSGDSLYLLFEDLWGIKLEIWFEGDIAYDVSSRDPEKFDPYWGGGTVFIHDGYTYLVDDDDATIENVRDGWCWFKARKMKYHVIPK